MTATITLPDQTQWVNDLLHHHPVLATTAWRVTCVAGLVSIEVAGGYSEAHDWHAAVGGRIFPSIVNAQGVRRQTVMSRLVTVECVMQGTFRTGTPLAGA